MSGGQSHGGFGSWWHLAARFFGALAPVGPRVSEERWALEHLSSAERSLYASMSGPDRRHAVGVARQALSLAADDGRAAADLPAAFVTAALLHDVGKIDAGLGTFGRVWATMAALAIGRERLVAFDGASHGTTAGAATAHGPENGQCRHVAFAKRRTRMASYLQHDQIGARLLEEAGSDPFVVIWAREHHLAEQRWTIDQRLGQYLKHADGD